MKKDKSELTIEEDLLLLQEKSKLAPISVGEILNILSERGQSLVVIFLCLPFCQPLQIPGLSAPFGLAIAFIGFKMAFDKYAWLPKNVLAKTMTHQTMQTITNNTLWLLRKMKGWIYPRLTWLCYYPGVYLVNGLLIAILGILLALPMPIPFSNLLAAWSLLFIGLGLLEDDGVFMLIGYFISLLTFGYFIAMIALVKFIL